MNRIFILSLLLASVNFGFSQGKNFIDMAYLETTAMVDTFIKPDVLYLNILIQEKDEKNKISTEELEARMIQKLKSLGIEVEKQLTLVDLGSNFKKYFIKPKDILKDKSYELKIFDTQTAGKVLLGLEEVGISNVNLGRTEYSLMEEVKLDLKSKAVAKAKKQADYLLKPLDQKVGRAIHITEKYQTDFDQFNGMLNEVVVTGYAGRSKQNYEPPAIEFKPIHVQSEVSVKFVID